MTYSRYLLYDRQILLQRYLFSSVTIQGALGKHVHLQKLDQLHPLSHLQV